MQTVERRPLAITGLATWKGIEWPNKHFPISVAEIEYFPGKKKTPANLHLVFAAEGVFLSDIQHFLEMSKTKLLFVGVGNLRQPYRVSDGLSGDSVWCPMQVLAPIFAEELNVVEFFSRLLGVLDGPMMDRVVFKEEKEVHLCGKWVAEGDALLRRALQVV